MTHVDTIEYKGHNINIWRDEYFGTGNPFDELDMVSGLVVTNEDGKHLSNVDMKQFDLYAEYAGGYTYSDGVHEDRLIEADEVAEFIRKKFKAEVREFITHGYSQSDWLKGMLIIPYERLVAEFGTTKAGRLKPTARKKAQQCIEGELEIFSAWAWGDIYGFEVEGAIDAGYWDGAVGGFYGTDFEKSGLLETAREVIDYIVEEEEALQAEVDEMMMIEIGA